MLVGTDQVDHETADIHTASEGYARRFSGKAGQWFLAVQREAIFRVIARLSGDALSVLDVGGGHGQVAIPLAHAGFRVTVLGSSDEALFRLAGEGSSGPELKVGNILSLPFADHSFDIVVCFRLLPHCNDWSRLIGELCRVAKSQVIVDYPTVDSINSLAPRLFALKKNIEKNTRPFIMFSDKQIAEEFEKHGFVSQKRVKQFFYPMVLHRLFRFPLLSRILEFFPRILGLTARFGSPVVAGFCKQEER